MTVADLVLIIPAAGLIVVGIIVGITLHRWWIGADQPADDSVHEFAQLRLVLGHAVARSAHPHRTGRRRQ